MLIAMVVVPLILIGALYFVLGQGIAQQIEQAERESGTVAVIDLDKGNYSNLFIDFLNGIGLTVKLLEPNTTTDVVELVKNIDTKIIYLIPSGFSANFSRAMPAYVVTYVKIESLTIGETGVVAVADRYVGIFNKYILETVAREKGIEEVFLSGLVKSSTKGFLAGRIVENPQYLYSFLTIGSFIVPVIVLVLVLFAAQLIATSIAIEKEEKMFETLLSLPISRMSVIGAKLFVSILISSVYMVMYGLMMFGFLFGQVLEALSPSEEIAPAYTSTISIVMSGDVLFYMILNVVGLALFMVSIALLLSLFAEDVRTAQTLIGNTIAPTIILVYTPMFIDVSSLSARIVLSLVPIASTVFLPKLAIVQDHGALAMAALSNIVYGVALFIAIRRIVNSEAIFTLKLARRKRRET